MGSAYEEVPLEAIAAKIMAQLARRNILITDVEIYEFAKKKLSFKETDDGILIKNKKFRFDDGPVSCAGVDEKTDLDLEALLSNPEVLQSLQTALQNKQPHQFPHQANNHPRPQPAVSSSGKRAKRYEMFDPSIQGMHKIKQSGMKFTQGKAYPIFNEEAVGVPPVTRTEYITADDSGKEIKISAEYFVAQTRGKLEFEDQMVDSGPAPGVDLWGKMSTLNSDMPSLR